ncbi:double-stranded RNA-binding protein 1-like [Carya illinoinensis]|uniref:double-stranded RNA-binding protein 1-like n=1 Tax=Carya illinoinensis TaxID=32201 RepID=UPI001C71AF0A|nr:double-stranded RNA-binding protein 1-like [Carya illinoinensis]
MPTNKGFQAGPSHEPSFRSTVIVNDVRYDYLLGFFNCKAAEQLAVEVALLELAKSSETNQSISQPIHETGLYKNLIQDYAQKMNYAIPIYKCQNDEGQVPLFSCTIEIGGTKPVNDIEEAANPPKAKKARFENRMLKKKLYGDKIGI